MYRCQKVRIIILFFAFDIYLSMLSIVFDTARELLRSFIYDVFIGNAL